MFDSPIYEKKDGVSMSASLGHVPANIVMTESEIKVVDRLVAQNDLSSTQDTSTMHFS